MSDSEIQGLIERQKIVDVFNRYAMGVDLKDRDLYLSCFAPKIELDMIGMTGTQTAEEWVDRALDLVGNYQATQHLISNHVIEIDGDTAHGTAYLQAQHFNPEPGKSLLLGGYYANDFVRSAAGWRISKLTLTSTWTEGW